MDNYQSQNVIMYLEKIASLLQKQNELLEEAMRPKPDPQTERLQGLQAIIAQALENNNQNK